MSFFSNLAEYSANNKQAVSKARPSGFTPLSSIASNQQPRSQSNGSPLADIANDGLKLSNTGNRSNIQGNIPGVITARPGGKLNEAEVSANAALASAYAQAQINRPDQYTPYGSSVWETDPDTGISTNRVTLDPKQQALLDAQTGMQTDLAGVGSNLVDRVRQQYSSPLDFSGAPQTQYGPTVKSVNTQNMQTSIPGYGNIQDRVDTTGTGNLTRGVDTFRLGNLTRNASYGKIQDKVDMSGVPSLVGGDALVKFQNEARDAAWKNAQAALDPQWNNYETGLETKLANQGVMQNSEAWNKAISEMSRNRQYDYSQAQNNAVRQGLEAGGQLFNEGLASNQNAYSQALNNGQFTNSAQNQGFNQSLQNAGLNNSVQNQMFNQEFQNAGLNNSADQQLMNYKLLTMDANNKAQAQGFGQNTVNTQFGNDARLSQYNMDYQNAGLNNSGLNQDFNNSLTDRKQYINELMAQRNEPLSALTSILNGTQPSMPDFSSTNAVGGIESPNTLSTLAANKQANAAQTAAKYQAAGSVLSSLAKTVKIPGFS